jgi:DNA polymerase-3 subunit delta'
MARVNKNKKTDDEIVNEIDLALSFYPWQEQQKDFLLNLAASTRLHHAFLLHGLANLGKFDFACAISAALLCEKQDVDGVLHNACQNCHACHLVRSMTHPDLYVLRPEKEGKQIPVDEIRLLIDFMSKSSGRSGRRMVIIDQCHQMNQNAANALLKFLEEPGENVHLFLVSSEIDSLLPTIRSRCQKLAMSLPTQSQALVWLKENIDGELENGLLEYAAGSPILAKRLLNDSIFNDRKTILSGLRHLLKSQEDLMSYVSQWSDYSLPKFLEWWHACLGDVLKLSAGADIEQLRFQSMYADIEVFAASINAQSLIEFMEELFLLRQQLLHGAPFTQALMLESVLIKWQALAK